MGRNAPVVPAVDAFATASAPLAPALANAGDALLDTVDDAGIGAGAAVTSLTLGAVGAWIDTVALPGEFRRAFGHGTVDGAVARGPLTTAALVPSGDAAVPAGFHGTIYTFGTDALGGSFGADVQVAQGVTNTPAPPTGVAALGSIDAGTTTRSALRDIALGLGCVADPFVELGACRRVAIYVATTVTPEAVDATLITFDAAIRAFPALSISTLRPNTTALLREVLAALVVLAVHILGDADAAPVLAFTELVASEATLAARPGLPSTAFGLIGLGTLVGEVRRTFAVGTVDAAFAGIPPTPYTRSAPLDAAIPTGLDLASTALGLVIATVRWTTAICVELTTACVLAVGPIDPTRTPLSGGETGLVAFAAACLAPLSVTVPTVRAGAGLGVGRGARVVAAVQLAMAGRPGTVRTLLLTTEATLRAAPGLPSPTLRRRTLPRMTLGTVGMLAVDFTTTDGPATGPARL